jgi:hypothetical protein
MKFNNKILILVLLILNLFTVIFTQIPLFPQNSMTASSLKLANNGYYVATRITFDESNDKDPQIHNGQIVWSKEDNIFLYNTEFRITTQITYDNMFHTQPQIYDGLVTWMGWDGLDFEIYLYDTITDSIIQITDNDYLDYSPQIDGTLITWFGKNGEDYEIFLFDIVSGITTQITANNYYDGSPKIHEGQITWVGEVDPYDTEVYFYDIETEIITRITYNDGDDINPQIHGGLITWMGRDSTHPLFWKVYFYDVNTKIITQIPGTSEDKYPQIHNGVITWFGWDGSDHNIFYYDTITSVSTQITTYGGTYPHIHDGVIAWNPFDGSDAEICIYNTITQETIQITDNDFFDNHPQIHNGKLTWEGRIGDGIETYEIFFSELEVPSIEAFIDIGIDVINLKSKGKKFPVYIELPDEYEVTDIHVESILLNNLISAELHPIEIGDYDFDGVDDLMVMFNRTDIQDLLEPGESVEIHISGKLSDSTLFEGIDTIRVK